MGTDQAFNKLLAVTRTGGDPPVAIRIELEEDRSPHEAATDPIATEANSCVSLAFERRNSVGKVCIKLATPLICPVFIYNSHPISLTAPGAVS